MEYQIVYVKSELAFEALAAANLINSDEGKIKIKCTQQNLKGADNVILYKDSEVVAKRVSDITRYFARTMKQKNFYGDASCPRTKTEVDQWLSFAIMLDNYSFASVNKDTLAFMNDKILRTQTYLVNKSLTLADIHIFGALLRTRYLNTEDRKTYANVTRWYKYMEHVFNDVIQICNEDAKKKSVQTKEDSVEKQANLRSKQQSKSENSDIDKNLRKQEGKFIELPEAEMGKVVVRFPPEASGYLHIGHAKAALLNQYYAEIYQGQLIMRFDDTNPAKEDAHFEDAILEDIKLLEITPDKFTFTSNYFDVLKDFCTTLLTKGLAYVDDTPADIMKEQRDQKLKSKNRDNSVKQNLALWEEMQRGTEKGQQCCVRAKIDYESTNGCMRDPTIYRCKSEPHPRTGSKFKVYPTYDFACPLVDSIEGVTHALRTTEYHDRDVQYYWILDALQLRRPYVWEYSRLNMANTVLSKRKLTWFVNERLVDGWDDPRLPTVRGILRRGLTVQALKQFITAQGSSRTVVAMEWDKIWAFNKKVIDPIATRYTALESDTLVDVVIKNPSPEQWIDVQKHPKDPSRGTKKLRVGSDTLLIERADAESFVVGENATFINWGNLKITAIDLQNNKVEAELNLEDKNYKNTVKVTWLTKPKDTCKDKEVLSTNPIKCYAVYFDHIINTANMGKDADFKDFVNWNTRKEVPLLGEVALKDVKKGEIIQLQRKGFFICDVSYEDVSPYSSCVRPVILFHVPDGHATTVASNNQEDQRTNTADTKVNANKAEEISKEIKKQGDKVRDLKSVKADKAQIDEQVKILLELKKNYKTVTGQEWKPQAAVDTSEAVNKNTSKAEEISKEIKKQGDKVRNLKSSKAEKSIIDKEVQVLLQLKKDYKTVSGQEWTPQAAVSTNETSDKNTSKAEEISKEIKNQGDKVRNLKSSKAEKSIIDKEVQVLLQLKKDYKNVSGQEWSPQTAVNTNGTSDKNTSKAEEISKEIKNQGDKVRNLKSSKADKSIIDAEVNILLELKKNYKTLTGQEWKPQAAVTNEASGKKAANSCTSRPKSECKNSTDTNKQTTDTSKNATDANKTGTRLGLEAKKEENFFEWYSQVITKSGMIEYYDVSGCYVLRPWTCSIWKIIKDYINETITALGVEECYFPMFVTRAALEKEKEHISDFAPEVAWVTRCGDSDLAEPIAIRPTSETVMYPAYAKWLRSDTELPLKLNQWNNVVRWEFKDPKPFLRTREFLWQEGHTAFATKKEAEEEVLIILDMYAKVYEDLLAVPVIKGRKTTKEKFAGGDYTTTVEAYISTSGRAIQGATSHHLGQKFSKMCNIQVEGAVEGEKTFVYQNSWGLTTRTIGVMIMVHGDDKGLVLPPRVAGVQAVVVPCGITASMSEDKKVALLKECDTLFNELKSKFRIKADFRNNRTPGWKFNHWELKGVPVRIELGPKDLERNEVTFVRRYDSGRIVVKRNEVIEKLDKLLNEIQSYLFNRAKDDLNSHVTQVDEWSNFCSELEKKNLLLSPFCGEPTCEDNIKADSARDVSDEPGALSMGAKSLCIPFDQPKPQKEIEKLGCVHHNCKNKAKSYTLFGRCY